MESPVPSLGLKLALLGLLLDHPMHPYEMHQQLLHAEALGLVWHLKQGHLYALLARLEEAGYVVSTTEVQGTRPPRKMLSLTAKGRDAFTEWVSTPVQHGRDFRVEFLAKLFFAAEQGATAVNALISQQRVACSGWIGELQRELQALSLVRRYDRLVLQFRLSQLEAVQSWLDQCERSLANINPESKAKEGSE
ncbi:MAG: PadR family transcriptional regulator [Ktedonobacterales bacterium]